MEEYLGIIKIFAGTFAPRGWAFCDGSLLQIRQNTALFSILGTTYGGDGQTTFALPNLQGSFPVGMGQRQGGSLYTIGQVGGGESTTLTSGNIPAHTHMVTGDLAVVIPCNASTANSDTPENAYMAPSSSDTYNDSTAGASMAAARASINLQTSVTGNSAPVSLMNPYLAITYIICVEGVYPSRN